MKVEEALARLGKGHRRIAARLLAAALDGPEGEAARTALDALVPSGPHGAIEVERLRFGPPETWVAWMAGHGKAALTLWPRGCPMPSAMDRRRAFRHPGVAALLAWGDGWTLADWIEGPTLAEAIRLHHPVAGLAQAVGEALAALHSAGLAHGDVNPANIVVSGDRPFLIDWYEHSAGTSGWSGGDADPVSRDRAALDRLLTDRLLTLAP